MVELFKEATKGINKQTQLIVFTFFTLLIIALVVWVLVKIWQKIKPDDALRETKKDVDKRNLSYPQSWYEQKASALYIAMKGIGTDESTIYRTLTELKNPDDFSNLFIAFGKKDGMNLIEWLIDELDGAEKAKVNAILQKIGQSI